MLSALCKDIRHVRAEEFSDIRTYDTEFIVREVMMFGKTPEEARASSMRALLGDGFGQSIDMVADALGVTLDPEKRTIHEMAVATAPRHAGRRPRPRHGRRPAVHVGGHRRRRAVHHRAGQLADGGGAPRPGVDVRARGPALRGRVRRRPAR